jgi:penicillin-binding protein 2
MQPLRRSVRDLNSAPELEVSSARLRVFGGVLVLLVGVLLGRLWFLQVLRGDEFRRDADSNRSLLVREVAPRGVIEDSEKQVLVTNRAQFTVFVVPADLPKAESERKAVLTRLAQILGNSREDMEEAVRRNRARASDPIPVAEDVSIRVLSRLAENRVRLPGVTAQTEPVRYYPHRSLAGHLLGYIGQINDEELSEKENLELGYRMGDFIGRSGVERQYDALLNGEEGGTWYEIDARGRRQRELRADAPVAGATLRLSLSRGVQVAAEKALEGRRGAAVALDPRDGRVLALANGPTYDPSLFVKRPLLRREYRRLIDPRQGYKLQNRAIASPQPPGSTFKIVTAAAGLALGKISAATTDYCTGAITLGRRARKRCHSRHGGVNLDSALAASCDVFFYHAGFRIQPTPLARWAERFGLGRKTGIDLPSEKAGTVPSPEWKRVMAPKFGNPDTGWYPGDTANMAIGQGDVQATPLQMAQVAAASAAAG